MDVNRKQIHVVSRIGGGKGDREWLLNGHGASFEGDENVLELNKVTVVQTVCKYIKWL